MEVHIKEGTYNVIHIVHMLSYSVVSNSVTPWTVAH